MRKSGKCFVFHVCRRAWHFIDFLVFVREWNLKNRSIEYHWKCLVIYCGSCDNDAPLYVAHLWCNDVWMETWTVFTNISGWYVDDSCSGRKMCWNVSQFFKMFSQDLKISVSIVSPLPMFHNKTNVLLGWICKLDKQRQLQIRIEVDRKNLISFCCYWFKVGRWSLFDNFSISTASKYVKVHRKTFVPEICALINSASCLAFKNHRIFRETNRKLWINKCVEQFITQKLIGFLIVSSTKFAEQILIFNRSKTWKNKFICLRAWSERMKSNFDDCLCSDKKFNEKISLH